MRATSRATAGRKGRRAVPAEQLSAGDLLVREERVSQAKELFLKRQAVRVREQV